MLIFQGVSVRVRPKRKVIKECTFPSWFFLVRTICLGGLIRGIFPPKNFPKINLFGYCNWAISGVGVPIFGIFGFFALFFAPRVRHGRKFVSEAALAHGGLIKPKKLLYVPTVARNTQSQTVAFAYLQLTCIIKSKGKLAIVPQRLRDCDACQRLAISKGKLSNGRHWLGDCDASQRLATIESRVPNGRHRLRNSDACQRNAV